MKAITLAAVLAGLVLSKQATAYEYPLQFTPNPGFRGLVVAGYQFSGNTVSGNCSYYTVHSGSGRGGGYHSYTTYYNQTCTWDLFGNLIGVVQGAPAVPAPISTSGTVTTYAQDSQGDSTGTDARYGYAAGFVNTRGSHYTWLSSSAYLVLPNQKPIGVTVTLVSDGDVPLVVTQVAASALSARAYVKQTNCIGSIPVGAKCSTIAIYDPTRLYSDSGLAYDTLTVGLTDNAGQSPDFMKSYTIVLNPNGDGGGGGDGGGN